MPRETSVNWIDGPKTNIPTARSNQKTEPTTPDLKQIQIELGDCLAVIAEANCDMIFQIYWKGQTEQAVSTSLGITQQKVNKKKNAILGSLLNLMKVEAIRT